MILLIVVPMALFIGVLIAANPWFFLAIIASCALGLLVRGVLTPREWWAEDKYGRMDPRGENITDWFGITAIVRCIYFVGGPMITKQRALNASETLRTVKDGGSE